MRAEDTETQPAPGSGSIQDAPASDSREVLSSDPHVMGGTPVFRGTRVPATVLFSYLAEGNSLDYFLEDYPSVPRELAVQTILRAGIQFSERAIKHVEDPDG